MSSATFDHYAARRQRHNRDVKRDKIAKTELTREVRNQWGRVLCPARRER